MGAKTLHEHSNKEKSLVKDLDSIYWTNIMLIKILKQLIIILNLKRNINKKTHIKQVKTLESYC